MINPAQYLMSLARQSQNPFNLMERIAGNNPDAQAMIKNLQCMKPEQWKEYADNMAKGLNTTPIQFLKDKFPTDFLKTLGLN